jgi:hypothetical protein
MSTVTENFDKHSCGVDRRRYHRRNVLDRQLVTVELGGGRIAILIDLSEDGIAVQPFRPITVGTRVTIEFDLPRAGGRVAGDGFVVWVGRTGRAGIRFSQLTERSWCVIDEWLRVAEDPLVEMVREFVSRHDGESPAQADAGADDIDSLTLDTVLDLITERACTVTRAEGAAFIVQAPSGFVCCGSVGNAPDAGVMVKPDSLTGEALRFGVTAHSGDLANDGRANQESANASFAFSAAVVPILASERVVGGIEVFASAKDAFTERDIARLKRLAEIASRLADDFN